MKKKSTTLAKINKFLVDNGALSLLELDGFLAAVAASPQMIMPSTWMDVAKIRDINFSNAEQVDRVMLVIMEIYNHINESVRNSSYRIPIDIANDQRTDSKTFKNVQDWSRAFLLGATLWSVPPGEDEALSTLLVPAVTLAQDDPDRVLKGFGEPEDVLLEIKRKLIFSLETSVIEIYRYFNWSTPKNRSNVSAVHIGRNDPCFCGSGKKYKKCCLQ